MPTTEQWNKFAEAIGGPPVEIPAERLIPIRDFAWTDDYSFHRTLTCKNHTTARYSTKNPFHRSIHMLRPPSGDMERTNQGECTCPFGDLAVIVEAEGTAS